MYNAELKEKFIEQYTQSINTAHIVHSVFDRVEDHERNWQADLCTRTTEELQPVIDSMLGLRAKSRWMTVSVLKEYVRWCLAIHVPDACDGMLHVELAGLDKVQRQMVPNPTGMRLYLDRVYDMASLQTIDNVYRCYLWMAYGGMEEADTVTIKASEVDLQELVIRHDGREFPIYKEAITEFTNLVQLDRFAMCHPNYTKVVYLDRVQGDEILRGSKSETMILTTRAMVSKKGVAAYKRGATDKQLSYHRAKLSGLFYRVYEMERAGVPANFSEAAIRYLETHNVKAEGEEEVEKARNRVAREYMEDYQRWKLAFSI